MSEPLLVRGVCGGRMLVWYQAKTNRGIQTGTFTRWKREGYGIHGETVESLPRRGP